MAVIDNTKTHYIRLENSDNYINAINSLLKKPSQTDLNYIKVKLDIPITDSSDLTQIYTQYFNNFLSDNFNTTLDWEMDSLYDFQTKEMRNIIAISESLSSASGDYAYWNDLFIETKDDTDLSVQGQGFSYSISGDLMNPNLGFLSGVIAGSTQSIENIVMDFDTSDIDEEYVRRGQVSAVLKELLSGQVYDSGFDDYSLNMNGIDDRPLQPNFFNGDFQWSSLCIYDYVFLENSEGNKVNISDLSLSDIDSYMTESWFRKVKLREAITRFMTYPMYGSHVKYWSLNRTVTFSFSKLEKYKAYINVIKKMNEES